MKVEIEIPKNTKMISVTTLSQPNKYDMFEIQLETKNYTIDEVKVIENDT